MVLESVTEDTIRELLKDSRATSTTALRMNGHKPESDAANDEEFQNAVYASDANLTDHHKVNNVLNHACHPDGYHTIRTSTPRRNNQQDRSPERRPFLPEIDPTGSMATVRPNNMSRLNNESRPPSSGRSSAVTVRNSLSEANTSWKIGGDSRVENHWGSRENTPTPPQPSRCSSANVVRPRTLSPITKNSIDR